MNRKEKINKLRKDFIIEKAEILFNEKGYHIVTMDDIALKSQYAKKTLYNYIESKEELFLHVYVRGLIKRVEFIEAKLDDNADGFTNIKKFGLAYFKFYQQNPGILKHQLIGDNSTISFAGIDKNSFAELDSWQKKGNNLIINNIKKGCADGSIDPLINYDFWFPHFIYTLRFSIAKALMGKVPDLNLGENKDTEKWVKWVLKQLLNEIKK